MHVPSRAFQSSPKYCKSSALASLHLGQKSRSGKAQRTGEKEINHRGVMRGMRKGKDTRTGIKEQETKDTEIVTLTLGTAHATAYAAYEAVYEVWCVLGSG